MDTTYVNTIIVGCVGFGGYLIAGALINAVGSKNILSKIYINVECRNDFTNSWWLMMITVYGLCAAGSCGIGLYWARNSMTTVGLSALYTTIGSISSTALIGVVVNLFPTSLR